MANKLTKKKPVVKKPVVPVIEANEAMAAKKEPVPDNSDVPSSKKDVVNAESARVLRDADAGKNLLNYASLEGMFKDCGM